MSDSEKANQTARSIILPVDGMTCAACSRAVEQAIGRLDGVEQASVSIATNRAAVSFNPAKVRIADIKLAIAKAGYTPLQVETKRDVEAEKKRTAKRTDSIRRRFILAIVFAAPLLYIAMGHMVGLPLPPFLNPMHHAFAFALCQLIFDAADPLCGPQLLQQRNQGGSAWKPEYGYASGDRLCRGISL